MLRVRARAAEQLRADLGHITAGLGISALGLAIAISVAWTTGAQAGTMTEVAAMPEAAKTFSEPLPSATDLELAPDNGRPPPGQPEDDTGTLTHYTTGRTTGEGRNPLVLEMLKGRTQLEHKELRKQNASRGSEVSRTSRDRLGRSRQVIGEAHQWAVVFELERLREEIRRKEEEERRLAEERALGTLRDGEFEGTYQPPVAREEPGGEVLGEVTGSGGARPVTGHYSIAAKWGAVGAWSRYHTGIDLSAPIGRPVVAAADGVVIAPVAGGWAGMHVIIEHPGGGATLYAHLGSRRVVPGQRVHAGEVIGTIGMTGRTFGPHLHFEYYPSAASARNPYATSDPLIWMLTKGVRL